MLRQVWRHRSNADERPRAIARAIRWQLRSRVSGPQDVQVYGGLILRCHPRSNSASNVHYFTPFYDYDEMHLLAAVLRPGGHFVDVGANIGTYSLLAASIVGTQGRVTAFEPAEPAASRLEENARINALEHIIRVHRRAAGREPGRMQMTSAADVSNTLVLETHSRRPTRAVDIVALDDVVADPDAVKIDVEGFETQTLLGMRRVLTGPRPPMLLVEVTPHLLGRAGSSPTELAAILTRAGYDLYTCDWRARRLTRVRVSDDDVRQINAVAIRSDVLADTAARAGVTVAPA